MGWLLAIVFLLPFWPFYLLWLLIQPYYKSLSPRGKQIATSLGVLSLFGVFASCCLFAIISNALSPKAIQTEQPEAKNVSKSQKDDKESKPKRPEPPNGKTKSPADPPSELPKVEPPKVAVAPPPRRIPLNRPPTGDSSEWVRRGEIRTRVVGASVFRPVLTNDKGQEFPSPDPLLVVWVETQSLTAANVELRRWINPLNEFAVLTDARGARIKVATFARGARVGGQLEGAHKLVPGGPGVVDVLCFETPSVAARTLTLTLDAKHVGEGGDFVHTITPMR
jgi:hypothetical protein